MAKLDKSQGFTFAYTNLYELYKKAQNAENALNRDIEVPSPLAVNRRADASAQQANRTEGQPEFIRTHVVPMGVQEAEAKMRRKPIPAIQDPLESLRTNIEALGEAQIKLRFLIQELDSITKKRQK